MTLPRKKTKNSISYELVQRTDPETGKTVYVWVAKNGSELELSYHEKVQLGIS